MVVPSFAGFSGRVGTANSDTSPSAANVPKTQHEQKVNS
jgi:hypothetical protein